MMNIGMNLQICFMNETASDGSDAENPMKESCHDKTTRNKGLIKTAVVNGLKKDPYVSLPARVSSLDFQSISVEDKPPAEMDFFAQQAKLQNEARIALIQAKELARVQMQVERQQRKHTRISDLVRQSLEKVRRVSNEGLHSITFKRTSRITAGHTFPVGLSSLESPDFD